MCLAAARPFLSFRYCESQTFRKTINSFRSLRAARLRPSVPSRLALDQSRRLSASFGSLKSPDCPPGDARLPGPILPGPISPDPKLPGPLSPDPILPGPISIAECEIA